MIAFIRVEIRKGRLFILRAINASESNKISDSMQGYESTLLKKINKQVIKGPRIPFFNFLHKLTYSRIYPESQDRAEALTGPKTGTGQL